MAASRAFITGLGIIGAAGKGWSETISALVSGLTGLAPARSFKPLRETAAPVGEAPLDQDGQPLPRTHLLALDACRQALAQDSSPPEALVVGTSTGGMPKTEDLLRRGSMDSGEYRLHRLGSVAEELGRRLGCQGPLLSVSTACASGGTALALGLSLIRSGRCGRVLVCGADALCNLTFFGFKMLQLVDPDGARPLDRRRAGMSLGEGAAALLLSAWDSPPKGALAELAGVGLSCDAHHPAAPHPKGEGARTAMELALRGAGLRPEEIDYLNLHGTGTLDNDATEALAVREVFSQPLPALSSTKGLFGHTLGAAGVLEAAICTIALAEGLLPANSNTTEPDPALGLSPLLETRRARCSAVLSNSLGFGGNNASLVLRAPAGKGAVLSGPAQQMLWVQGESILSGAGGTQATLDRLSLGQGVAGRLAAKDIVTGLSPRELRKTKRLPRMALALAAEVLGPRQGARDGLEIYLGTAWGALDETHDFLRQLFDSNGKHASPIDFMNSVHNAPAGRLAISLGATGANLTMSGGGESFAQALLAALALGEQREGRLLLMGVDQSHAAFTPLLQPENPDLYDGGGALLASRRPQPGAVSLRLLALSSRLGENARMEQAGELIRRGRGRHALVLAGTGGTGGPGRLAGELPRETAFGDFNHLFGRHSAAGASAAALAARLVRQGSLPPALSARGGEELAGRGILVMGLEEQFWALELMPC